MYSLLIIFSRLLNALPAAWVRCARTPHVWRCYCPSSTSRNAWNPQLQDSVFLLARLCCIFFIFGLLWTLIFVLDHVPPFVGAFFLFFFFFNILQNRVAILQDGYFQVEINISFSIFNKTPSIVIWVCHAGHVKMSTPSHVYLRVTSNVNPNLEWLCQNRMNHLLLSLFQSRAISFSV